MFSFLLFVVLRFSSCSLFFYIYYFSCCCFLILNYTRRSRLINIIFQLTTDSDVPSSRPVTAALRLDKKPKELLSSTSFWNYVCFLVGVEYVIFH